MELLFSHELLVLPIHRKVLKERPGVLGMYVYQEQWQENRPDNGPPEFRGPDFLWSIVWRMKITRIVGMN